MTLRRNRARLVVLVSLVFFLFTGQAGAKNFFWCLDEGGQSELKHSLDDTCCLYDACCNSMQNMAASRYEHNLPSLAVEDNDCGLCLDIAAFCETALTPSQDPNTLAGKAVPRALGPICSAFTLSHHTNYTLSFHLPPPRVNQTLLMHRTVVLLN